MERTPERALRGEGSHARAPRPTHPRAAWALILAGLAVHAAAQLGLALDVEAALTWRYELVWWSYIAFADGVVHLRAGRSMLLDRPRAFLLLAVWSAVFWIFFEALNLVLENWYYVGVSRSAWVRWSSAYISFATVLPGILETADLLRAFGVSSRARCRPFAATPRRRRIACALGVLCLLLPFVAPRYAFPLVWGALVLLIEPFLAARGERGLWTHLAAGRAHVPLRLLLAGLVAGLLWEAWNWHAQARWIYTVPFFEEQKLFEMPLLGFLGFPPFALEAYAFARLLVALRWCPEWELEGAPRADVPVRAEAAAGEAATARPAGAVPGGARRPAVRGGLVVWAALLASLPFVHLLQVHTVRSHATRLRELPALAALGPEAARFEQRLGAAGIERPRELARTDPGELEALLGPGLAAALLAEARLAQLAGMGARGVRWLASIGVASPAELAAQEPAELVRALSARGQGPAPPPTPAEARVWWRAAR